MSLVRNILKTASYTSLFMNRNIPGNVSSIRNMKRWVSPTLRELRKRKQKMGPEAITPRSSHIEWNYNAEIFAFSKRLNENFDAAILKQAFTHRSFIIQEEMKQKEVGIENPETPYIDNSILIQEGEEIASEYIKQFLKVSLPLLHDNGLKAIHDYLMSETMLSNISSHLGTKDLIQSADFPVVERTLAETLLAVIGALAKSSDKQRANLFVRDFICTQLNQKDINELWEVDQPLTVLSDICKFRQMGELEPRLLGDCGKNTILAVYHVGIYCNKKLLGTGFGENVDIAIDEAAKDCLRDICGTQTYMQPFNFNINFNDDGNGITKLSNKA